MNCRIGLVLGGGFAKGAYQFGVLQSLLRYISPDDIAMISASSIGALNGYALSADKMRVAENMWRTMDYHNLFHFTRQAWFHHAFDEIVQSICHPEDVLSIPLTITLCRFSRMDELYLQLNGAYQNYWKKALRATIAFPIVSAKPIRLFRKYYLDGGFLDNIPIAPVIQSQEVNTTLVLHCDPKYLPIEKAFSNDKLFLDIDVTPVDVRLRDSFVMQSEQINRMLDIGIEYGERLGQTVFGSLREDSFAELRHKMSDWTKSEYPIRKKKQALDTIGTTINQLYCSFGLDNQ